MNIGGITGSIEICITYPLEYAKCQLQLPPQVRGIKKFSVSLLYLLCIAHLGRELGFQNFVVTGTCTGSATIRIFSNAIFYPNFPCKVCKEQFFQNQWIPKFLLQRQLQYICEYIYICEYTYIYTYLYIYVYIYICTAASNVC